MANKDRKYEIIRNSIPHQLFTELDPINNYLFMRGLETAQNVLDENAVLVVDSEGPLFEALTGGPQ